LHDAADLFVFPSVYEGFGNALAEALAAGLPVVASDLDVIRKDVLGHSATAACLVPPGNVAALAEALDPLLPDALARGVLSRLARAAGTRFERVRMLAEYRELYGELTRETVAA